MRNKVYLMLGLAAGAAAFTLTLSSRVSIPRGAKAVSPFDKKKYLGTWYEIARMDFRFEKGLDHVTATYSLIDDETIRVDNRGFNVKDQEWRQSIGKAKPAGALSEGRLKVSFFCPFYAGYNVIAIDPEYRYALVAGNNLKYLWLLSREKTMPQEIRESYLEQARALGYDTNQLVWTNQLITDE
ncbi:lipocalin family protein [Chitinophaga sp. GbtcB8]|uniref:lipocalin family protein n=1 Tax=Chitinophaga sp. GbtcB8 TaxID=2824753 RepID=UPI001C30F494|nr:lipocalin family protein [Chitinophaga sp. GbtcB8]